MGAAMGWCCDLRSLCEGVPRLCFELSEQHRLDEFRPRVSCRAYFR